MRPELIVAGKEFRDHITSKRFLIVFVILLLLSVISMVQGMSQYNETLQNYKESTAQSQQQPWFQEQVASLRQQIADAQANGASSDEIASLQYQLDKMINPDMPSMLYIFSTFNSKYFIMIGMVLSITVGFDLITREREEGSLKSLLSHPVYRDSVINGKFLAVVGVLVASIGSVFLITLAVMLFYSVVPSGDDLVRIFVYFLMALLYCGVFFALAMMASALAKSSAMSIMIVLGIAMALLIIPQSSYDIAGFILGQPPEAEWIEPVPVLVDANGTEFQYGDSADVAVKSEPSKIVAPGWSDELQQYYERQRLIIEIISSVSPMYNFGDKISNSILYKSGGAIPLLDKAPVSSYARPFYIYKDPTILDSLAVVWTNILALLIELIVPIVISYIAFLRADVR